MSSTQAPCSSGVSIGGLEITALRGRAPRRYGPNGRGRLTSWPIPSGASAPSTLAAMDSRPHRAVSPMRLGAVVLVGCLALGGLFFQAESASATSAPLNACNLVSQRAAARLMNHSVHVLPGRTASTCVWKARTVVYIALFVPATAAQKHGIRRVSKVPPGYRGTTSVIDGTHVTWITLSTKLGGGELTATRHGSAVEVRVTTGVNNPYSVARQAMGLVFKKLSN